MVFLIISNCLQIIIITDNENLFIEITLCSPKVKFIHFFSVIYIIWWSGFAQLIEERFGREAKRIDCTTKTNPYRRIDHRQ